ncbi:MAG: thioredoxin family protein [Candidatus Bathyarchaeota archaeon]|nr:thioredoxin family protein [Candidatus Bathyarchaeota archaeon]
MIEVTNESALAKQLKEKPDVVALFYSSWCPFCRSFLSTFNKYAKKQGDAEFIRVKIEEDENPLWENYQLEAVPSVIRFAMGQVSRRLDCRQGVGLNEQEFTQWLATKK